MSGAVLRYLRLVGGVKTSQLSDLTGNRLCRRALSRPSLTSWGSCHCWQYSPNIESRKLPPILHTPAQVKLWVIMFLFLVPLGWVRDHALLLPTLAKFALGMSIIVGVPPLFRRMRLPAVVGLLLSGVLLGPYCLGVMSKSTPIASFFAELGKLLLMFFAGLEIDLALFRQKRNRTLFFGLLTTLIPLILGTLVGVLFGYWVIPAIVLGSLLASHTLLGLPIVSRLGLVRLEPITVTVGATVLSDTLSLIVFAVCVPVYKAGFSASARRWRGGR